MIEIGSAAWTEAARTESAGLGVALLAALLGEEALLAGR